ncbi:MAG TPA: hypothetical protein PLE59_01750 [Bacteroidales bacterium]|jgi:hypothetical protein|nr:hypothetical protein [Bacteroidales bacterium]HPX46296.1 hypothetical protein [Bacteroidales bacterium]HQC60263.1 hypothetical protein [Bacteroidales bacterium]HRR52077.1 hypothetical protein [Bacteroidales bacterium]HRT71985.1 hypothetical protein [Bacteroidales bacterium]
MNEFHCLDIEFPDVDFNSYYTRGKTEIEKIHHAHLYANDEKIELRIFYDDQTYFGEKLITWANNIDPKKFGSFIKAEVTNNDTNKRLQKVDLSEATFFSSTISTSYYESENKYVIVRIDTVKFYWNPVEDKNNTGEFYLDDKGFRVVEPFYSVLLPKKWDKNDGNFNIRRMKGSKKFYKLNKCTFRPEFNFVAKDDRENRTATITKEPKIQFKYQNGITEKEAIFYGDVVLMLASFYYHIKIDYILRRIHLPENTITIKNIEQKNFYNIIGNLRDFEIDWDFNKFLQESCQTETIKNFTLLSKAIKLFNQSHLVDNSSAFLIRYNIIEICDKQKRKNIKFKLALDKNQTKEKQDEALKILLETININEHEDFKKRWQSVLANLQYKPMEKQLVSFLESQVKNTNTFPVSIKDLIKLRNNITHGSIDKVDVELLRKANILLYRISGILILNLMGIKDWKLNTIIK